MHTLREVSWITPYPDRLLDDIAPSEDEPEAVVVTRETIERRCASTAGLRHHR